MRIDALKQRGHIGDGRVLRQRHPCNLIAQRAICKARLHRQKILGAGVADGKNLLSLTVMTYPPAREPPRHETRIIRKSDPEADGDRCEARPAQLGRASKLQGQFPHVAREYPGSGADIVMIAESDWKRIRQITHNLLKAFALRCAIKQRQVARIQNLLMRCGQSGWALLQNSACRGIHAAGLVG